MKLKALTPMLYVNDLDSTILFYEEILGLKCRGKMEGWASLERDSVAIMLAVPPPEWDVEELKFWGSLYLYAEDVDAIWDKLKDKVRICYPIEDFDYGMREFTTYDYNNYLLQFGQDLEEPKSLVQ